MAHNALYKTGYVSSTLCEHVTVKTFPRRAGVIPRASHPKIDALPEDIRRTTAYLSGPDGSDVYIFGAIWTYLAIFCDERLISSPWISSCSRYSASTLHPSSPHDVGISHVSKVSVEQCSRIIAQLRPDVCVLELCKDRTGLLTDQANVNTSDPLLQVTWTTVTRFTPSSCRPASIRT